MDDEKLSIKTCESCISSAACLFKNAFNKESNYESNEIPMLRKEDIIGCRVIYNEEKH